MPLKLKNKIALGVVFLFALLLLVGGVSIYYFNRLITESKDVLKTNYESVEFGKNMFNAINTWTEDSTKARKLFEDNLKQQEANITETGELQVTTELRSKFNQYTRHTDSLSLKFAIQQDINRIIEINLRSINNKSNTSQQSADNAKVVITIITTICLLIGFTFIFNFPGFIANPVVKLTDGIRAIAKKNYSQRIHLNRQDEFGEMADAFNNMASQLNEYEHSNLSKIMFEKQRAETVINSLKNASIGIDNNGTILFANPQALQLLNLREGDMVGQNQEEVKKRNDLFRFLTSGESNMPFKIVLNDKENYFTKEIIEIRPGKEKIGTVIILENITPYKEMDVAKTNFIATISHELKTPLASSDFSLRLLEDERVGSLTDEQKELVQSLKGDNQRLLRILSELLDLSQVESGKMQLNMQSADATGIITKAIMFVQNAAKEKNIEIKQHIADKLPMIHADAEKSVWILTNFLTNAIRYTPENGTIILEANQVSDKVEIGVQDYGQGIEPTFQHKIFDRFYRVPGITEKKGTGLGLAISKDFAEAMGGEIGVQSEPGKGSYFYCRFRI